ncbi:redoxin domain-containing protein [Herpetosiphon gulosus]|uniref:Thioredoxin domain-containing protein n=1 Tax=Herpetosiphon gulosus TaxID=1973496 RepID=A0ABP9X6C7_9CHLR
MIPLTLLTVGHTVPDWTLSDVHGQPYTLSRSLGLSGALLTFIRGMFCPYCTAQLHQLREHSAPILAQGVQPLVIAAHGPEALAVHAALENRLPILIDSDRHVITTYGLRHDLRTYADVGYPTGALVHPTTALLDTERRLRWIYRGINPADRPRLPMILEQIALLNRPAHDGA